MVFFPEQLHLVGGLEHVIFPYMGNFIIPIDELIFFRGVFCQPPTSEPLIRHRFTIDSPYIKPSGTFQLRQVLRSREV